MFIGSAISLVAGQKTLTARAIDILGRFGPDAHLYLPGVGVISGKTAGNYLENTFATLGSYNSTVGGVLDCGGSTVGVFTASNVTAGVTAGGAAVAGLSASIATVVGEIYSINYIITASIGQLSAQAGGTTGTVQASNFVGTITEVLTAGTTGTTNVGLVGRIGGLTSCTGSVTVTKLGGMGPELLPNGLTGSAVNTGATIVGGVLNMVNVATGYASFLDSTPGFVAGKTYKMTVTATGPTQNGTVLFQGVGIMSFLANVGTVVYETMFVAGAISNSRVQVNCNNANCSGTVSVSIKEVLGIHATQASSGSRPTLRRGIQNLLTYSQDFSNAAWAKSSATVLGQALTFGGGSNASIEQITAIVGGTASKSLTVAVRAYVVSGTFNFRVKNSQQGVADNFLECSADTIPRLFVLPITNSASAGTGSQIIGVWNSAVSPQAGTLIIEAISVFAGTLTAAQIQAAGGIPLTTAAAAWSTGGNSYWEFDGVDDSLALSAPLFQMADDHCVIAGIAYKGTNGTANTFFEVGDGSTGARAASMRVNGGGFNVIWSDGTIVSQANGNSLMSGASNVCTAVSRSGVRQSRQNGILTQTAAGNPTNPALTLTKIGARSGGIGEYATAQFYPIIAIKGTVTDADMLILEKFVGSLSGVTI
jgi:hypothetical protein